MVRRALRQDQLHSRRRHRRRRRQCQAIGRDDRLSFWKAVDGRQQYSQ